MELPNAAIEFMVAQGNLRARSTADRRWYDVHGITRTLHSIPRGRTRVGYRNMVSMALFVRVVQDLHADPRSTLDWVTGYLIDLNVPQSLAVKVGPRLALSLRADRPVTPRACARLWDRHMLSQKIEDAVRAECKDVFQGKRNALHVGPVSRSIVSRLEALGVRPIGARVRVAGIPRPDLFATPPYAYHNGCARGCVSLPGTRGSYAEVELVAHDAVKDQVALFQVRIGDSDALDEGALWRCNARLWLTWVMFSLTYPSVAERSAAYLLISRPGTERVIVRGCMRPTISKTLRAKFPLVACFCRHVLNCLTPDCVNMRVESRAQKLAETLVDRHVDHGDLCYRNIMLNIGKLERVKSKCMAIKD